MTAATYDQSESRMAYAYEIRDRSIGEVLDQAIFLFRDHIKLIAIVTGLFVVPLVALADLVAQMVQPDPAMLDPDSGLSEAVSVEAMASMWVMMMMAFVGTGLLFLLAVSYANGVLIHAIACRFLGKHARLKSSLWAGLRALPWMALMLFLTRMIVGVGACACVLPGLILASLFYVAPEALVLERTDMVTAIGRSVHLVWGSLWQVAALIVVVSIVGIGISSLPDLIPARLAYHVLYVIAESAYTSFKAVVAVVLYFAMRCRVEHLDLDLLAAEVDLAPAAEAAL